MATKRNPYIEQRRNLENIFWNWVVEAISRNE